MVNQTELIDSYFQYGYLLQLDSLSYAIILISREVQTSFKITGRMTLVETLDVDCVSACLAPLAVVWIVKPFCWLIKCTKACGSYYTLSCIHDQE